MTDDIPDPINLQRTEHPKTLIVTEGLEGSIEIRTNNVSPSSKTTKDTEIDPIDDDEIAKARKARYKWLPIQCQNSAMFGQEVDSNVIQEVEEEVGPGLASQRILDFEDAERTRRASILSDSDVRSMSTRSTPKRCKSQPKIHSITSSNLQQKEYRDRIDTRRTHHTTPSNVHTAPVADRRETSFSFGEYAESAVSYGLEDGNPIITGHNSVRKNGGLVQLEKPHRNCQWCCCTIQ
eukprot:Filipodium_phascolosomae@DN646_c0_g1_i1.p1